MERSVEPELLDDLPPHDPRAVRSRRDLVRVNAWMGNGATMARALAGAAGNGGGGRMLLELGAGDGRFLLGVAQRLPASWQGTRALLLDRVAIVRAETRRAFSALGWHAESVQADALNWLEQPASPICGAIIANLFLHHFEDETLTRLLRAAANKTETIIAVEPRRTRQGMFFSRWLWLIGCSAVTVHDARVSVRAGFNGCELTRLLPEREEWTLTERATGWFSHVFVAQRKAGFIPPRRDGRAIREDECPKR